MTALILLVVVVALVLWMIGAYNRLISLKNQVANAWKQIDVQLKRRHDLIPNLVNTVKGAMNFERTTLEAVISARNKAVGATGVQDTARAEGELTPGAWPALRAHRGVSRSQVHRQRRPAAGRAHAAPRTRSGLRGSSTTTSPRSTTRAQATFPDHARRRASPRRRRRSCGRSRTPASARCPRWICRSTSPLRERRVQSLRPAGIESPPLDLARHRIHRLLRLGRLRGRSGFRPAHRPASAGLLPPRRSVHRDHHDARRREHLLVLVALRGRSGCCGPPGHGRSPSRPRRRSTSS